MNREEWKDKIKEASISVGTYRDSFEPIVDTLASILEQRDEAERQFKESGGRVMVVHTATNGAQHLKMNPYLAAVNELNRDALAYWRDLGLTPSGLKKLTAEVVVKADTGFEALLAKVMDE